MTRMIPPVVTPGTRSPGEVEVFETLKSAEGTSDWVALHSLDLPIHVKQIQGEADFVVIVPGLGVAVLEVKAHRSIVRRDGLWFFGTSKEGEARGPFKQASEACFSLSDAVQANGDGLADVLFWPAVVMPFVRFDDPSPEWHAWQLIDKAALGARPLEALIRGVLTRARQHVVSKNRGSWLGASSPTPSQVERLVQLLRGDFEVHESPKARMERLDGEVLRYSAEQAEVLDGIQDNPRIHIDGPAGTGKTVLAIESARRMALQGQSVWLACYNRHLANQLRDEMAAHPGVRVRSVSGMMLEVSRLAARDDRDFWATELPEGAVAEALDLREDDRFDSIILDEAQDCDTPHTVDFLDLMLKGGLRSGAWWLFGDFANQRLYEPDMAGAFEDFFEGHGVAFTRFSLHKNCRNTPRIAEYAQRHAQMSQGYRECRRPDDGIEPRTHVFTSISHQGELLVEVLEQLRAEGFSGGDVAILSTKRNGACVEHLPPGSWRDRLTPLGASTRGKIRFGTIHEFKGLEAKAVILTDVGSIADARGRQLIYTGATRALHRLHVLISERARSEFERLLLEGSA